MPTKIKQSKNERLVFSCLSLMHAIDHKSGFTSFADKKAQLYDRVQVCMMSRINCGFYRTSIYIYISIIYIYQHIHSGRRYVQYQYSAEKFKFMHQHKSHIQINLWMHGCVDTCIPF